MADGTGSDRICEREPASAVIFEGFEEEGPVEHDGERAVALGLSDSVLPEGFEADDDMTTR